MNANCHIIAFVCRFDVTVSSLIVGLSPAQPVTAAPCPGVNGCGVEAGLAEVL